MRRAIAARCAALALALGMAAAAAAQPSGAPAPLAVFAAASLTEVFRSLEPKWLAGAQHRPLAFQFAASSALALQIEEGAPADVLATADEVTMKRVADKGLVGKPALFARNRLVIAVEKGNPKHVANLADLARPDLVVVLAAPEVPAGRYARQLLDGAHVAVAPRSLEENVKAVLTKVSLGEADAGIVYVTDVRAAAGKVEAVAVPEAAGVEVGYWIAPLAKAPHADAARAFVDLVLGAAGRAALEKAGFTPP
jgi:molybdate transport system substrate-binding protein